MHGRCVFHDFIKVFRDDAPDPAPDFSMFVVQVTYRFQLAIMIIMIYRSGNRSHRMPPTSKQGCHTLGSDDGTDDGYHQRVPTMGPPPNGRRREELVGGWVVAKKQNASPKAFWRGVCVKR